MGSIEDKQEVQKMIDQVRARLVDLEVALADYDGDCAGMVAELDKADDKIFFLEQRIEKALQNPDAAAAPVPSTSDTSTDSGESSDTDEEEDDDEPLIIAGHEMKPPSEETKQKVSQTAGELKDIVEDSTFVVSELADTFNEIKDTFNVKGMFKR